MAIRIETINRDRVLVTAIAEPTLRWHIGPVVQKGVQAMPVEVTLTTEEKVRLAITPMTPGGQPATIDGEAQWTVEGTCTIEPIDATSAWALAGDMGDSIVTVACDADLGSGVVPIGDTCLLHVQNPMAASVGLAADTPVLKTA